jgi:membrane associated rhomboid family serine protease
MKNRLLFPIQLLLLIWAVFIVDAVLVNISFCKYGILPRQINGLIGILTCPFLHASPAHIISNSMTLLPLLYISVIFFKRETMPAIGIIIFIGGGLVWVFGRSSYHVGASGLIYGLVGFITFYGIFEKRILPILIGIIVGLTYGTSMLIGMLPIFPGVSWEGHLFGGVAGVFAASYLSKKE